MVKRTVKITPTPHSKADPSRPTKCASIPETHTRRLFGIALSHLANLHFKGHVRALLQGITSSDIKGQAVRRVGGLHLQVKYITTAGRTLSCEKAARWRGSRHLLKQFLLPWGTQGRLWWLVRGCEKFWLDPPRFCLARFTHLFSLHFVSICPNAYQASKWVGRK